MTETTRALRWYGGLALVFFGLIPTVMLTLLVTGGHTPRPVGLLLIGGIPLVAAAAWFAVRGIVGSDPEASARQMQLSMALVAGADVLMLGGNALIRMVTS